VLKLSVGINHRHNIHNEYHVPKFCNSDVETDVIILFSIPKKNHSNTTLTLY
jgi:hypothetical protein